MGPSTDKDSPKSSDLDGWQQAIADNRLGSFRLEAIAAAFQDLGQRDKKVQNALAQHLSDAILKILRQRVGFNHPNRGEDIILRVQEKIFVALLCPSSPDGKSLRVAFVPRVLFRMKDSIAEEKRERWVPGEAGRKEKRRTAGAQRAGEAQDAIEAVPLTEIHDSEAKTEDREADEIAPVKMPHTSSLDEVQDADEQIDVTRILERVPDPRKRLAFCLFMDGVPYKSKNPDVHTIAKAVGISEKAARDWIKEVRQILRNDERVRYLKEGTVGGGS